MNPARTKSEAILGINYCIRVHELHCRLYRRIRGCMTIASLLAGSAAMVSVVQGIPGLIAVLGIAVATIGYVDAAANISALAERHSLWTREFNKLLAVSSGLTIDELDARKREIIADATVEIESLRPVAYNDVLESGGFMDGMRPESRAQRLMRAIA